MNKFAKSFFALITIVLLLSSCYYKTEASEVKVNSKTFTVDGVKHHSTNYAWYYMHEIPHNQLSGEEILESGSTRNGVILSLSSGRSLLIETRHKTSIAYLIESFERVVEDE